MTVAALQDKRDVMPVPSFTHLRTNLLQRKCACGGTPGLGGECAECRKKRLGLQDRASSSALPTVQEVLNSPGSPLDADTRVFMESRFGHDFGRVRVHTDVQASESARAVDASAYTVGHDIVFDAGRYAPRTRAGQRLLAHELAHVTQQATATRTDGDTVRISEPDSRHEQQAEAVGREVISPRASARVGFQVSPVRTPLLQRQPRGVPEVESASDVGDLILRLNDAGQVEFLYGTPAVPGLGRAGIGFRCRGRRCEPVAGSDPSRIQNRTYTLDEALGLLRGSPGAAVPSTGAGRGGTPGPWPGFGRPEFRVCLPWQMTPSGQCCPPEERWNPLQRRCGPETAPPRVEAPTPSPLSPRLPQPSLGVGTLQLGLPQVVVIDRFGPDSETLPATAGERLDRLAEQLRLYPGEVRIEGHTDSTFTPDHNQRLSERRAEAVRRALVARRVEEGRLRVEGLGERQRLFPDDRTAEQKARNRRVSVTYRVPLTPPDGTSLRILPELTLTPGLIR
jgi:outer membrane protein OmpA-like peptidoglycan-associated protein